MKLNQHFMDLQDSYLFAEVASRTEVYRKEHPQQRVISLGIGDVTRPICPQVISAMKQAAEDEGNQERFVGYGPYRGFPFLQRAIISYYAGRGISLEEDEIFVSDGAKSDIGNLTDLFSADNHVWIPDPVYPVYVDSNILNGRLISFLDAIEENNFLSMPPWKEHADIIYLCSPNNPTGSVYTKEQLSAWVNYALEQDAVILFDAAYEAFICDDSLPHSIYEIPGARECAIEICSFSKMAGFTGIRCGWTVIPSKLIRKGRQLNQLWYRRQSTKFNGVSYVVQRGAEAVFTPEGLRQTQADIAYYLENARLIRNVLEQCEITAFGGENAPYIWLRCPNGMDSWKYFDYLLHEAGIVGTPGAGFGRNGEGFLRLTAFGKREDVEEAVQRFASLQ